MTCLISPGGLQSPSHGQNHFQLLHWFIRDCFLGVSILLSAVHDLGYLSDRSLELLLHLSEICLLIFASVPIECVLLSQRLGLWPLLHHPALTVTQTTLEHLKEISRNRMPNTYFIRLLELYNGRKSLLRISKNNIETHHKPEILLCCWSTQCQVDDGNEQLMCMRLPSTVPNPS